MAMQEKYDEIVALTDQFCQLRLNEEYRGLWHCLLDRPSQLLFDKSQTPHMRAADLCRYFGLSPKTGSAKSTAIMELVKSGQADPNWTLPNRMADNPMAWLIQLNGLIVDARHAPREIQEEAFRRGLIPYLP